jgi:hypothetical protein
MALGEFNVFTEGGLGFVTHVYGNGINSALTSPIFKVVV